MWTRFDNDGNVPTQCAASTASHQTIKFVSAFCQQLRTSQDQVASEGYVDASGRRYACMLTEESSRLRASASLRVKILKCLHSDHCPQGRRNRLQGYLWVCTSYPRRSPLALSLLEDSGLNADTYSDTERRACPQPAAVLSQHYTHLP